MKNANIKELGFTLIELLVVVLIIGILAAVAVPQYKKAVYKSKLAALKPMVSSLAQAADVAYMATGVFPVQALDSLEVGFPFQGEITCSGGSCSGSIDENISCSISENKASSKMIGCTNNLIDISYFKYSIYSAKSELAGKTACCAYNNNALAERLCQDEVGSKSNYYSVAGQICYKEN